MAEFGKQVEEKAAQHALLTAILLYQQAGAEYEEFLNLVERFWENASEESVRLQHWQA